MKWKVVLRSEALSCRSVCAPFSLRKLSKVILFNLSYKWYIQQSPIGTDRKAPGDISFSFELNADVRILIYILMLHALNIIDNSLPNTSSMYKFNGYREDVTALRRTLIHTQSNLTNIANHNSASFENFMHDEISNILSDAIAQILISFLLSYISSLL